MLPSVRPLVHTTRQMVLYTVLVVLCSAGFAWSAAMGPLYGVGAAVLGAVFLVITVRVHRSPTPSAAMGLFAFSITYLTALFALMAVDTLLRHGW